jgi:hypothetical protein
VLREAGKNEEEGNGQNDSRIGLKLAMTVVKKKC